MSVQTTYRIIRHDKGFVQITNEAVRDKRLSFCARGILAMVLSHSDGWKTSQNWILSQTEHEGITVVRNALKQLEKFGYLTRSIERHDGRIVAHVMLWREDPVISDGSEEDAAPDYDTEDVVNPDTGTWHREAKAPATKPEQMSPEVERLKYLKSREVNAAGGTSLSDAEDAELAEMTGQFAPRDATKPEQMTPDEFTETMDIEQESLQTVQTEEKPQLVDNQQSHHNAGNALLVNAPSSKTAHSEYHQNQNTMQTEDNPRSALTPVQQKMEKLKLKLSVAVANNLDRRQAAKDKGNASGVWKIWADAYRSATGQNPSEPTRADLAILFRTSRRLFSANVAKIEAGLKWVCERWTTIRVSHFSWMRQTPAPMLPDVRFFTKFSDRFDEAFRDAARVEETAKAPARQQNIDRLVRKGYSKEAAAAKAARDEAEEQQTTELNQAAESASRAARELAMERSKTAQAEEAAPRWRRLRSAPVVVTGAYEDDSTLPSL